MILNLSDCFCALYSRRLIVLNRNCKCYEGSLRKEEREKEKKNIYRYIDIFLYISFFLFFSERSFILFATYTHTHTYTHALRGNARCNAARVAIEFPELRLHPSLKTLFRDSIYGLELPRSPTEGGGLPQQPGLLSRGSIQPRHQL